MAKKGYIIETQIAAKDVDAFNQSAVAASDIDGGTPVALGALAQDDDVFTVTVSATGEYMAYNPTGRYTVVDGEVYAGLTRDPRAYTNVAGEVFDVFKLQAGDIVGFTAANIATGVTLTKNTDFGFDTDGKIDTSATNKYWTCKRIDTVPFPQKGIGDELVKVYQCLYKGA